MLEIFIEVDKEKNHFHQIINFQWCLRTSFPSFSVFLGNEKGRLIMKWQEQGWSQRHKLQYFPSLNPVIFYLNFPRVNSLCRDRVYLLYIQMVAFPV